MVTDVFDVFGHVTLIRKLGRAFTHVTLRGAGSKRFHSA
jgi:hypothetical protein